MAQGRAARDMPDNYDNPYADSEPTSSKGTADESEEMSHETAVLPKSICPDMKVGDEMVLKITGIDEDSYQVAYAPEKGKGGDEETDMDAQRPADNPDSMASMME